VVFYAMGYRGDVLPFVAIARAMGEAGHDVPFVVPREFHPLLRDEPFRCIHSGRDFAPKTLDSHAPTSPAGGIASVA
jgi:UDP:flavonoid glycosyltransferase YjiC (YdhE family)